MTKCVLVPTGRHVVAMGVSPWLRGNRTVRSPKRGDMIHRSCRPFGTLRKWGPRSMGLRPWLHHAVPSGLRPCVVLRRKVCAVDEATRSGCWLDLRKSGICGQIRYWLPGSEVDAWNFNFGFAAKRFRTNHHIAPTPNTLIRIERVLLPKGSESAVEGFSERVL